MKTEFIEVDTECQLAVDILSGNKGSFVLVHGLASNARLWDGVAQVLNAAGYNVAIVDQRGHGRSSKPSDGYDFKTISSDLSKVVTYLQSTFDFPTPIVVGQSWGGAVVESFATDYPGLTLGIATVDGGFNNLGEKFKTWEECEKVLTPPTLLGIPYEDFDLLIRASHPDWPETGINGVLANMEKLADGTFRPWLTKENHMKILWNLWQHNPFEVCANIEVPILFIPAGGDPVRDNEKQNDLDRLSKITKNSKTVWFNPSHHDIHAQFPKELAQLLIDETNSGIFS